MPTGPITKTFPAYNKISKAGFVAITAGIFYNLRWIYELHEGRLKNMNYSSSFVNQYFFVVQILMVVVLVALYRRHSSIRLVRYSLSAAIIGLTWTVITRTLEAFGSPGPWGFFGSPGLILLFGGLFLAGLALTRKPGTRNTGRLLQVIACLRFSAGFIIILLFNLLGRNLQANQVASVVGNIILLQEGCCWMVLGYLLKPDQQANTQE